MKIKVEEHTDERIDRYLARKLGHYSRSFIQKAIRSGQILVNGRLTTPRYKIVVGDIIDAEIIPPIDVSRIIPAEIKPDIIYEDEHLLAINKPSGLVVHPAPGHYNDTLLNGLVKYANGNFPVFLVHRLDKDTSGIMLVAKSEIAKHSLSRQFQNRTIEKVYLAVVAGKMAAGSGIIDASLNRSRKNRLKIAVAPGRNAQTRFVVKQETDKYSFLEVYPLTGRTHQIRAHLSFIKRPILGDQIYGGGPYKRLMLHAYRITFQHPITGKTMTLAGPVPPEFKKFAKNLV